MELHAIKYGESQTSVVSATTCWKIDLWESVRKLS
jgi:hypothetical protein